MNLVDTDVLIDIQRGHPPAIAWFSVLPELPGIPGFVAMELVQDARNLNEVKKTLKLIAPFVAFWPTSSDCLRAFSDFAALHHSTGLGLLDALIAATALGLSATLYTFNIKHYSAVPGLVVQQPYVR